MGKKFVAIVTEVIILLLLGVILFIVLTGGTVFRLGPLVISMRQIKNPLIFLMGALLLRKLLSGKFIYGMTTIWLVRRIIRSILRDTLLGQCCLKMGIWLARMFKVNRTNRNIFFVNLIFIALMLGYGIAIIVTEDPILFAVSLPIALAIVLLWGLINIIHFCWVNIRDPKTLLTGGVGLVLFLVGGWAMNRYCLPSPFHPISVLGNIGIALFMIFWRWSLKKPHQTRLLGIGTGVWILFIGGLTIAASITYQSAESSSMEDLQTLPYLAWVSAENPTQLDVTQYAQQQAFEGLNIYNSRIVPEAYLIDMSGKVLHTWSADIEKGRNELWHYVKMCKNGDLLVINKERMLIRLGWNSQIKWIVEGRFHHDIAVAENDDIYVLARKNELVFFSGIPVSILNDYLMILSPDGTTKRIISLFHVVKQEIPPKTFEPVYRWLFDPEIWQTAFNRKLNGQRVLFMPDMPVDILHNNTITILDQDIPGVCKKGNVLISVRQLDLIGIVDLDEEKLVWSWGPGHLSRQHHPTMLENGNILIFDNGVSQKRSRIVELDPQTKQIVWEYEANPPENFYSSSRGSSQRLPNGNTLIAESNRGRVFEVTPSGEIVWEFYNPEVNEQKHKRGAIYRMMRITDPEHYPLLKDLIK